MSLDTILLIDDEPSNLVSFKALFRRRFNVLLAKNIGEALLILEAHSMIKVIICDQKLENESGVNFLKDVKFKFPDPIRIILTGFEDVEVLTDAINAAEVFRFISKPWNEIDFDNAIVKAIEVYDYKESLKKSNSDLKKAYNELTKFVYSASHDMRAPLASVIGLVELAKEDPYFKNDAFYLPNIEKSILKLDDFVRNIVEYYQNREKASEFEEVDLHALLSTCIESLNNYRAFLKVSIELDLKHQTPIVTDPFRLQIILSNLISNGIKYQKESNSNKKVKISSQNINNEVELVVSDNGIGIEHSKLPDLFKMFFRATTQSSGSGIGLYIVQEAVNAIGGRIAVNSIVDEGSEFRIYIPTQI
ncbi:MAG: hybrid sensor histidine kinase/response regulator [Flavobacteriales bacterium]|nr:hybrid sensor histidine kinase/response regulator [Flavobacteriales bacterium]